MLSLTFDNTLGLSFYCFYCIVLIQLFATRLLNKPICEMSAIFPLREIDDIFTARRVYIARTMPWQDVCPSVRLFVCLSHAGIVCKRLYISSKTFYHRVALPFQFCHTKRDGNIPTRTPLTWAQIMEGGIKKSRFSTNIWLYIGTDARQSHSYYRRRIGNSTQAFEWYHFEWP